MIKTKYIKIITTMSLASIFALQLMWLCNTYMLIKENICEEIDQILHKAIEEEALKRFDKTPKGTNIEGGPTDSIPEITYLEEGLYNLGYYISIEDVDSIISIFFLKHKINSNFILNIINPKTQEILQQRKKAFFYWVPSIPKKFLSV